MSDDGTVEAMVAESTTTGVSSNTLVPGVAIIGERAVLPTYAPERRYRAVISYKHQRSSVFAERLQVALMAYAKPLLQPPTRLFPDEGHPRPDIKSPALIRSALEGSEFLNPLDLAGSGGVAWVQGAVEIWCAAGGDSGMLTHKVHMHRSSNGEMLA